jgi:hypothetical protein
MTRKKLKPSLRWRLFWKPLRRVQRFIDRLKAPWPLVGECFSAHRADHACEQCHPTHVHKWKAWPNAPRWVTSGPGVPIRCARCGARKCDFDDCNERRHDHKHIAGAAFPVFYAQSESP